jgi:hypothetical protein
MVAPSTTTLSMTSAEVAMSRSMGAIPAELVADLVFRRRVVTLCRRPRLMAEFPAELAAKHDIGAEIEAKLARYNGLSVEALTVTGGDCVPLAPLHEVSA